MKHFELERKLFMKTKKLWHVFRFGLILISTIEGAVVQEQIPKIPGSPGVFIRCKPYSVHFPFTK